MRTGRRGSSPESDEQALRDTAAWFVRSGLPYFVPEQRESARAALRSRRTLALLALTVVVALAAGVPLAWFVGDVAVAPATLTVLVGLGLVLFAMTTLRVRPIATWAVGRTLGSLGQLLPMATRALPLLLVFVMFLFINAEVWQLSATLDGALLWLTVLLFATIAVVFLLVRLPEEIDSDRGRVDREQLVEACRRTPLERRAADVVADCGEEEIVAARHVARYEKANLVLVLVITQAVQVLVLSLSMFGFFMLFGGLTMRHVVQEAWIAGESHALPLLTNLSAELVQVSVFLAAFSGLYFTVYAVTDETYRGQFFSGVKRELDRAVGVRTVYVLLRGSEGTGPAPDSP